MAAVLKRNQTYRVLAVTDYTRKQRQGPDEPQIGDTVRIMGTIWAVTHEGKWGWGVEVNGRYGTTFGVGQLEPVEALTATDAPTAAPQKG
jgi:hypothetical protein